MIPTAYLLKTSFFLELIISIAYSLKDSQNFFMQSLTLYTLWLFSILFNDNIVDIEKPDGTCSISFVVDTLSRLFLHLYIFPIKHSRFA